MAENVLMNERLKKLARLKELDINPYPNRSGLSLTPLSEVLKLGKKVKPSEKTKKIVSVAGRVMSMRDLGKIVFADLHDETSKIQLYIEVDKIKGEKELVKLIDIGDIIGASGVIYRTKRGELSVFVKELVMLSKSLRPLPEKWHGLKDKELIYRKRYLELITNPEVKEKFRKKTELIKAFRKFMDDYGFLEVQTPILQTMYGGALAEPFITHHNALNADFYLRIAPELYLKRLLVAGYEKVYEIGPNFRNEGFDASHLQEIPNAFEFYWAYENYEDLMKFCEEMISKVMMAVLRTLKVSFEGKEFNFKPPYPRMTFRDAVLKATSVDINKFDTYDKLALEIKRLKVKDVKVDECNNYGALLDEFYKRTVRPNIIHPTFLTNYPIDMKPLAKRNEADKSKSNAFQLLVNGWEIVNAYDELNDPLDQRDRLEEQQRFLTAGDKEAHPLDQDFLEALEYGMPPIAGFGLGLDRFFTLILGFDNIRESVFFPTLKPEPKH